MTVIELRFPTGKWHATPWGRQVNEGAVEWPPAPWRLLRALIAVWHHKCHDVPEDEVRELIIAISGPPVYQLPTSSSGHTRHYMPTSDKKTKIFDTFIALAVDSPVVVAWPDVTLSELQRQLLGRLLRSMSYFGRAESWVVATLGDGTDFIPNAAPLNGHGVGESQELVRLLTPIDAEKYSDWRMQMLEELASRKLHEKQEKASKKGNTPGKEKLTKKDLQTLDNSLPDDVFDALHAETDDLRKAGWNRPPASEWVAYVREKPTLQASSIAVRPSNTKRPTVARFAVAGAVRPNLTDALWIGERARQFIMGCSKRENGGQCSYVFSGKSEGGNPNRHVELAHQHSHYLCESNGPRNEGRITHLTVYAPGGFSEVDAAALSRFNRTWGDDGHDLQFVLLGIGRPEDFGGMDQTKGQSPILASSEVWVSRTPFVPTDHFHIRGRDKDDPQLAAAALERELGQVVCKELSRRSWLADTAQAVQVTCVPWTTLGGTKTTWLKFRRTRQRGGGQQASTHGYGFRLTFDRPMHGPIALGYGAHFGLGLFAAEG